jgi:hypothetical protein
VIFSTKRSVGKLRDEIEELERRVKRVESQVDDFTEKIQRQMWRLLKRKEIPEPGGTEIAPPPTNSAHIEALDPISAKLLARRNRTILRPPEET